MALSTSGTPGTFLKQQISRLFIRSLESASIATEVATVLPLDDTNKLRIPIVAADPTAGWVAEGSEITPTDATLAEVEVTFKKLAGLSIVSTELAEDANPEAAKIVGDGLARDIAHKLDAAFFANTTTNGPAGIKSLTTTVVSSGGSWVDTDPFTEAVYAVEGVGAVIDSWVANPADALLLSSIKETTTSNRGLLEPDPTKPARRTIGGIPLYTSPSVTAGEVWGIPHDRVFVAVRRNVWIEVDKSVYFTSDRIAIKATMRAAFGFPHPLAIAKVTKA